ncbi:MAG: hypothetical protein HC904_01465 [Blastochloris sp.]|nr:hypothetical protein [Blastochloris sp.]
MDLSSRSAGRLLLVLTVLPVLPQVIGSIFNIWYNTQIIIPALPTQGLHERFHDTVVVYNVVIYPLVAGLWIFLVFSMRKSLQRLMEGRAVEESALIRLRRRAIHLPWLGSALAGLGWFLCIPVFLGSLFQTGEILSPSLSFHLIISFFVSAVIALTHSFFLIELGSHRLLFPIVFAQARADQTPGAHALNLRGRGLLWILSAGACPIGSLLLLIFAPVFSTRTPPGWLCLLGWWESPLVCVPG